MRKCWDVDYYVRHHMVGGFFNDAHGTGKPVNATYVTHEIRLGYQHPYESAPWVSKRVFLCATRDIAAGEELLVTYGTTYHKIHFASSSPGMKAPAGGQQLPDAPVQNFVGRAVEKDFVGLGIFEGVVKEFHARDPGHQEEDLYTVRYSDGEEEDYTLSELCPILKGPEQEGRGGRG